MPNDDDSIIIERKKDCSELVRNLGAEWERFTREMELMTQYRHKLMVVCAPDNFQVLYDKGYTKLHPNFVYKQLATLQIRYGVSTIFLPNRTTAENYIFRLFTDIINKTRAEA